LLPKWLFNLQLKLLPRWLYTAWLLVIFISLLQPVFASEQTIFNPASTSDLNEMKARKTIRALVAYSKTDFFFYKGGVRGLQAAYLKEYEKFLNHGVKKEVNKTRITYIPVQFDDLIPALNEGRGDIAAAFLTLTPERKKQVKFVSGRKRTVSELIVSHKSQSLKSLEDLSGKIVYVLNNSSYAEHLRELNKKFTKKGLTPIRIVEGDEHLHSEDILELVNSGILKITVVDDYKAKLWKEVLPDIKVHENIRLAEGNYIGWAIRKNNPKLAESLENFAKKVEAGTLLGNMLFKRYYENTRWIKNPINEKEMKKFNTYIKLFKKYGQRYEFDHLALMAQAYQESGLDQDKKSHRGAVGIMQVLPSTAADKNVNVSNIHKLENNIHAGTRYLAFLRDRYFSEPEITEEDKLAFSWAAYNAGPSNVIKMRNLAKKMGLNPNIWSNNVKLAAGKIIGRETVQYVDNIIKYYVAYKLTSKMKKDIAFHDSKLH
jgi:membrane-bound lytic murein transglycosylase MltF